MKALYEGLEELFWKLETPPKVMKVTSEFYYYIVARAKRELLFKNDSGYVAAYLMGVEIIVDDTIEDKYCEFEF